MKKLIGAAIISAQLGGCIATPEYTTTEIKSGIVRVYDFGEYKLHAYDTTDVMADEVYLLETPTNLIGIESPAFAENISAWREYIAAQNKPMDSVLLSYHPNGGTWYDNAQHISTDAAVESRTNGEIGALVKSLGMAYGPDFDTNIASATTILKSGRNIINGTEFIITDDAGGYTIEIPAINVLYVHMLGADSHSILTSPQQMNEIIANLEKYKSRNYSLIISGHHTPETPDALDTKIEYIRTAQKYFEQSKSADEFIEKMKAAFPNYVGENYLDMSAAALFK